MTFKSHTHSGTMVVYSEGDRLRECRDYHTQAGMRMIMAAWTEDYSGGYIHVRPKCDEIKKENLRRPEAVYSNPSWQTN